MLRSANTARTAGSLLHTRPGRPLDDRAPGPRLQVALVAPPYFEVPPAGYGGVEAVVATLADALVARGHRVTVLGAGAPGTAAGFVPVWDRTTRERLGEPFPEVTHAIAARRAVGRLASRGEVDVVHDHTLAGPLNALVYAALGLPTVVTVHGPVDGDMYRYYRFLGEDVCLVAISDRQRALAPATGGARTAPGFLLPAHEGSSPVRLEPRAAVAVNSACYVARCSNPWTRSTLLAQPAGTTASVGGDNS